MYYSIFEGSPYEDKVTVAEQYYNSLIPKVKEVSGFIEDNFFGSLHTAREAVNVAEWESAEAVGGWRNESTHLGLQGKASHGVYESYRLRMGWAVEAFDATSDDGARQYVLLSYGGNVEGTPMDDVTSLHSETAASEVTGDLLDSSVFQGPQTLWISAWRSVLAASKFEIALPRSDGDAVVRVSIERDYTKTDRKDAPSRIAGESRRLWFVARGVESRCLWSKGGVTFMLAGQQPRTAGQPSRD